MRRVPTRCVAILLFACLLRALLPLDAAPAPERVAGAAFPCAGHACGCASAEDCRTSCCCTPGTGGEAAASGVRVLAALKCHGGGEPSAPAGVSSWVAVLPSAPALPCERPTTRFAPVAGARVQTACPEPATPPPRFLSFVI